MRMPFRVRQLPLSTGIVLLVGVLFTGCCGNPPAPTPSPVGCPKGKAPSTQAELDACLAVLAFDASEDASDHQPLTVIESSRGPSSLPCPGDASGRLGCRYGPLASIQPAIGAQRYSDADLRQGRIIAKLSIDATETEGYEKYGMVPGRNTYWWVQTDEAGTGGTSVFVTQGQDGKLRQKRRPLDRQPYTEADAKRDAAREYPGKDGEQEGLKWWRAIASWIWDLKDEIANTKCGAGSCK